MGNLLLWVHHHGVGGGVGLFIQLRAHDGLDLELDRQHWLWSDPDHAVAILVLLKLRLNVTRTCKSIFKNRLKRDTFVVIFSPSEISPCLWSSFFFLLSSRLFSFSSLFSLFRSIFASLLACESFNSSSCDREERLQSAALLFPNGLNSSSLLASSPACRKPFV